MSSYRRINSVVRALGVLEALNRRPLSSVEFLHAETGVPKPTIVRLLATLIDTGFVRRGSRYGTYYLTERVAGLSSGYHSEPPIIEASAEPSIRLTKEIKWPVGIAVFEHNAMVLQYSTIPYSPIAPYHSVVNKRYTMLGSALGRAYIAYLSNEDRAPILRILKSSEDPAEAALARNARFVERIVQQTRALGYSMRDPSERPDSYSIAVPILLDDFPIGTMAITWFRSVMSAAEAAHEYAAKMHDTAQEIAERIRSSRTAAMAAVGVG